MTRTRSRWSRRGPAGHRWLLGIEPVFEGGWFHKKEHARSWDVEEHLTAVALLGDVVVDLAAARSLPALVELHAYPILRDVEVRVPDGASVEVTGRWVADQVGPEVPNVPADRRTALLRVVSHPFRGDTTVRVVRSGMSSTPPERD
jgi:hypothetical protein